MKKELGYNNVSFTSQHDKKLETIVSLDSLEINALYNNSTHP